MKRARWIATAAWILSAAVLLCAYPWRASWWGGLLVHTAMAALVGALADWYAVVALFRKPLGISWQTAWIPRSREKIVAMATHMVTEEILTPAHMYRTLRRSQLFHVLLAFADEKYPIWEQAIRQRWVHLPELISPAQWESFSRWSKRQFRQVIHPADVLALAIEALRSPQGKGLWIGLGDILRIALADPRVATWCEERWRFLIAHEAQEHPWRAEVWEFLAGSRDQGEAGRRWQRRLLRWSKSLQDPESDLALRLDSLLSKTECRLRTDVRWREAVESWVGPWRDQMVETHWLAHLEEQYYSTDQREKLAGYVAGRVRQWWQCFLHNPAQVEKAERAFRWLLLQNLPRLRQYFKKVVEKELAKYSGEDLARLAEAKVADDLQMIRVNGTLVGAVVGAVLYCLDAVVRGVL